MRHEALRRSITTELVLEASHADFIKVVVTDYPDAALIENLRFNISNCGQLLKDCSIHAEVRNMQKA